MSTRPAETEQLRGTTENALAALWKDALALAELPVPEDNFFALGGDSTAMVMVEMRIQEKFLVELPVGTLLNVPSLRGLARLIDGSAGANGTET